MPESTTCTPYGLINVQMSTILRPAVRAACISGHFGTLATESSLDLGLVRQWVDGGWSKKQFKSFQLFKRFKLIELFIVPIRPLSDWVYRISKLSQHER